MKFTLNLLMKILKKIFTEDLYGKNFTFIHSFIGISKKKRRQMDFQNI